MKISDFPILEAPGRDVDVPVAAGGENYRVPLDAIAVKEETVLQAEKAAEFLEPASDNGLKTLEQALLGALESSEDISVAKPETGNFFVNLPDTALRFSITEKAKRALFDEMWVTAGGTVITPGTTYGLNGLTDITFKEAVNIVTVCWNYSPISSSFFKGKSLRTNLPPINIQFAYLVPSNYIVTCSMSVVNLWYGQLSPDSIHSCSSLVQIGLEDKPLYDICYKSGTFFTNCGKLEIVYGAIRGNNNFSVQTNAKLTLENFRYWVDHSYNTSPITITVHADVMAALTGEASAYPFNGGSREQWTQLVTDAQAKQITFATT